MYDGGGFVAGGLGGDLGLLGLGNLVLQQIGRCERVVAPNAPVLRLGGVADQLVLEVELNRVRSELGDKRRGASLTEAEDMAAAFFCVRCRECPIGIDCGIQAQREERRGRDRSALSVQVPCCGKGATFYESIIP